MVHRKLRFLMKRAFFRFLLVGATAVVVDYGSFFLLYGILEVHLYLANSLSFGLGLITSFLLNRLWTFGNRRYSKKAAHQFSFYAVLALVNLLLTNFIVGSSAHYLDINPKIGKIIAIAMISMWNFFLYKTIIFSQHNLDTTNQAG